MTTNTDTQTQTQTTETKTKGTYTVTDAISGQDTKVIPLQLRATAARLNLTVDELLQNYVGHSGKAALKALNLTEAEVTAKFPNLHPNVVANCKRCFRVEKAPRIKKVKEVTVTTPVVAETVVAEAVTENLEIPVDTPDEVVYNAEEQVEVTE